MQARRLKLLSLSGMALLFATLPAGIACAQAIDYTSLQDLFGEPVTTSATGTPQKASQVAANMFIITADMIKHAGTRSIPQIVGMYVPGIDVLQTANGSFDVGVRGYQQAFQPRLLVLVDGRQVFVDDYSRTIWNNIPVNVDDIRQIEVIKGAASALFGSNAAAGAINIVTYSPIYDHDRVATATGGTEGTGTFDVTETFNGKWGGTKVSAGIEAANNFSSRPGPFDVLEDGPRRRYLADSTTLQLTPTLQFNLEGNVSTSRETTAFSTVDLFGGYENSGSIRGGFAWQTKLGTITSDTYYNHISGKGDSFITNYQDVDLLVSKLEDRFSIGSSNIFRVMAEFRNLDFHQTTDTAPPFTLNAYSQMNRQTGTFGGSWLWQIRDNLSWTNAIRFDHLTMSEDGLLVPGGFTTPADYNHTIDAWSANSGLSWNITPADTARLTFGRGIIMPSLDASGFQSGFGPEPIAPGVYAFVVHPGNPFLFPTVVQNFELGYDRRVEPLKSTFSASVFYNENTDIIGSQVLAPPPKFANGALFLLLQNFNEGSSHALGGELDIAGATGNFHWNASYSYAYVKDSPGVLANLDYAGSSPRHHVRLVAGYSLGNWDLDGNAQYLSSTDMLRATSVVGSAPVHVDGYVTVGGRIAYSINQHFVLAAEGTQLNAPTLMINPYPRIERQAFASLTFKY